MHIAARIVRGPGDSIALSGLGMAYATNLDPNLEAQIREAAQASGQHDSLTVDQWAFYALQVDPSLGRMPAAEELGTDHTTLYNLDQYWTMVTALTGVRLSSDQQAANQYAQALAEWQAKVAAVGAAFAGPVPLQPGMAPSSTSVPNLNPGQLQYWGLTPPPNPQGTGTDSTHQPPPTNTAQPTLPAFHGGPIIASVPAACSFYQSYDSATNACSTNLYLVGGVLGVGFLLFMMHGKKKRG